MATSIPHNPRLPVIVYDQSEIPDGYPAQVGRRWYIIEQHALELAASAASTTGAGSFNQPVQAPARRPRGADPAAGSPSNLNALAAEISGLPSGNSSSPAAGNSFSDPRSRKLDTFYDIGLLVSRPDRFPKQDIGVLRTKWQQAFQQTGTGSWDFVEYVPAWTDPNWDERFLFIRGAETVDAITAQYAKPGFLQTQRPALMPGDAQYSPSATAKRWGFYPFQSKSKNDNPDGSSGVTPTLAGLPGSTMQRQQQQQPQRTVTVTVRDLERARQDYEQSIGAPATDEGFRQALADKLGENQGEVTNEQCRALIALQDMMASRQEREEYQRFLLGGNTSNEVGWEESSQSIVSSQLYR